MAWGHSALYKGEEVFDEKTSAKGRVTFEKSNNDSPAMSGDIRSSNNKKGKLFVSYTSSQGELSEKLSIKIDLNQGGHSGEIHTVKKRRATSPDFRGLLKVQGGELAVRGWLTTGLDGKKNGINLLFDPIPMDDFL